MKNKVLLNSLSAVLLQFVNIITNFIIPWIIINEYGSEVNGLVQSITQFLTIVAFAELGVGAVIQSTLYTPIVKKDYKAISKILSTGNNYFKKIAIFLIGYVLVLTIVFPVISESSFGYGYSAILIISISISTFAQYYFGLIRAIFLNADLKGYIHSFLQIFILFANIIVTIILVNQGCSIQIVKLISSVLFLIRPVVMYVYIKNNYQICFDEKPDNKSIPQMWNGIAQHISAVVLEQTDVIVLTVFSTLKTVSIYSVYHMIVYGVRALYNSLTVGLQSAFGRLWALGNKEKIENAFSCLEFGCHFLTVFLYCCTGKLIIPFVEIYTKDVSDASYINVGFAILITVAIGCQCLRTPYNILILASGHYKQTQRCYIIAAIMNIIISVIMVNLIGMVGVAIGTLCALLYQTIWMAIYDYTFLIERKIVLFIKQMSVDVITATIIICLVKNLELSAMSYLAWFVLAIKVGIIALCVVLLMACVFYKKEMYTLINSIKNKE